MANAQIKDKLHNTGEVDDKEKYTALAMQESRLKKARAIAEKTGDWSEFQRLGGDAELKKLETIIHQEQKINYTGKKVGMDAGRENQFQKKKNGTEVSIPMVTKSSDHSGKSVTNKIMSNDQALQPKNNTQSNIMTNKEAMNEAYSLELIKMRYLIEYMDNNNNNKTL